MKSIVAVLVAGLGLAGCELPSGLPRFQPTYLFPAEAVSVDVTSQPAMSSTLEDLSDIDEELSDNVVAGALVVDVVNPSGATGQATVSITGGGQTVEGTILLSGGDGQRIPAERAAIQAFLGRTVTIEAQGTFCPATGCGATQPPFAQVTFETKLEITLEIGGEG